MTLVRRGNLNAEGYFQFLHGRGDLLSKSQPPTLEIRCRRSTRCLGAEGELQLSVVGDAVAGTLLLGIQMGEPTNSSTRVLLEGRALGIQEVEVGLLLPHVADGVRRGRAGRAGFH